MVKDQTPIKAFVSKKNQKITAIALAYLVKFDAYKSLKERFKDYKWIETPVPSKAVDVMEPRSTEKTHVDLFLMRFI